MRGTGRNRSVRALLAVVVLAHAAPDSLGAQAQPQAEEKPYVRQSWTADRRAFGEGDVLTVILDERTFATQHTGTTASSSRSRDGTLSGSQNVINQPGIPTSVGAGFDSRTRGESRNRGDNVRESRFYGEMSVRVTGIEPSGMLRVTGTKRVNIDRSVQEITLTGLVRPQDVAARNLVESARIADLDLRYASRGSLGKPRGGIVSRLLGWVWP
jgi:flagellar L-ring protein FlgH